MKTKIYQSKTCEWDGWAAQTSGGYRVGGRGSLAGMAWACGHTDSSSDATAGTCPGHGTTGNGTWALRSSHPDPKPQANHDSSIRQAQLRVSTVSEECAWKLSRPAEGSLRAVFAEQRSLRTWDGRMWQDMQMRSWDPKLRNTNKTWTRLNNDGSAFVYWPW